MMDALSPEAALDAAGATEERPPPPGMDTADSWPPPDPSLASREVIPPPAWPECWFPRTWGRFITEAAEGRGCPPDYVGLAVLAAVAGRLGNARWGSPWPGWEEPPVLWCAAVGAPSSGKSAGLNEAADALGELEEGANEDWPERLREHRTRQREAAERRAVWEGEVKTAIKLGNPPPMEPEGAAEPPSVARRRTVTTDPTTERAATLSAENPRGMVLQRDELAGWLGGMGRYSGAAAADRAFWLLAHGGGRWQPDRVKDGAAPMAVPHLAWCILGAIQPDRVASLLLAGDDDGLAARFLYAWPAPHRPVRPSTASPAGRLAHALRRLDGLPWPEAPKRGVIRFTSAAADGVQALREEAAEREANAAGLLLSWIGKLPGFTVRLAVVFAHLESLAQPEGTPPPEEVNAEAVARARGFLTEYALPMARRVFGEAAAPESERDARRLARWLLRQKPRPDVVNARALTRGAGGPGISAPERIEAALSVLAEAGWCRSAPAREGDGKGRQRKDWAISPRLAEVRT